MPPGKKKSTTQKKRKKKKKGGRKGLLFFFLTIIVLIAIIYVYLKTDIIEKLPFLQPLFVHSWNATLYFGDEGSDFLIREYRKVSSLKAPEKKAQALVRELIRGPYAKGIQTIPSQTKLLSITIENNGLCRVNFSEQLSTMHPGGSSAELLTVYSIVNTLAQNIKQIKKVKILINSNQIETIAGHIDCSSPIYPDPDLIH